ncbi:transposase [Micromonospora sp. WMMA1998]|uniref:transposase n=1 Tax=Micromonospora sp. WMMA1998 TaxID=3015167 RepID=UPI00248C4BCD|nr:transposase [Micromonospora sp. WMMA1998]WBC14900.1 transposase [Micromonospora sp. WMMA1998]
MSIKKARAALSRSVFTGISGNHLDRLVAELAEPFGAAREGRLHRRHGERDRHRWPGAGAPETLTLRDRLLVTLAWLRLAMPHEALALLYGVDRSTVSTAVRQIRPPLANRGFATPSGQRLHTLADVLAYAAAEGLTVRLDGTEIQVRRPKANRPGRRVFVSGKKKQNTIKATVASDAHGRPLWAGAIRPGRQHDQTAVRTEGIDDLLDAYPGVQYLVDDGYRGLARPTTKTEKDAPPNEIAAYEAVRKAQSSQRIPAEHAIAAIKWWRTLQRFTGRRDALPETIRAVTSLASDRAATR